MVHGVITISLHLGLAPGFCTLFPTAKVNQATIVADNGISSSFSNIDSALASTVYVVSVEASIFWLQEIVVCIVYSIL